MNISSGNRKINRRTFITASAATPLAGMAGAESATTISEQIQVHVGEIWKLLKMSAPEGTNLHRSFFVIDGNLEAAAQPEGLDTGRIHAKFQTKTGEWRTSV